MQTKLIYADESSWRPVYNEIQTKIMTILKQLLNSNDYPYLTAPKKATNKRFIPSISILIRPVVNFAADPELAKHNISIGRKELIITVHVNLDRQGSVIPESKIKLRLCYNEAISKHLAITEISARETLEFVYPYATFFYKSGRYEDFINVILRQINGYVSRNLINLLPRSK